MIQDFLTYKTYKSASRDVYLTGFFSHNKVYTYIYIYIYLYYVNIHNYTPTSVHVLYVFVDI